MSPLLRPHSLAEHYDQTLHYTHACGDFPQPAPTSQWPPENIALYERYRDWLLSGGTSPGPSKTIYLPVAGHALALNLKPHNQINLEEDLERVMDYTRAKHASKDWIKASRNGLEKFRRFLRFERGLGEVSKITPFDASRYTDGLPGWLVTALERYQRLVQRNWRAARLDGSLHSFWSKNLRVWRFLVEQCQIQQLDQLKRQHILDYVDQRLAAGYAVGGVNGELRYLHSFLLFLQDEGSPVPQSLLRIPGLKPPDSLPKYLTDEQMRSLREEIERGVRESSRPRDALLERAVFYLLWQGGLRLGEVEELLLEDLDLSGKRLAVRDGKGLKDRTIYLSETIIAALLAYLPMRGQGITEHVFLYRNVPLKKDLIYNRLKEAGERAGVKVYPHRLRHTCATQLLNAGCRVTSIQAFLGHKNLNTTMIYARAHDQTIADDYFAAMQKVEQRLNVAPIAEPPVEIEQEEPEQAQLLALVEQLSQRELCFPARLEIVAQLRQALGWVESIPQAECFLAQPSEHPPPRDAMGTVLPNFKEILPAS